VTQERARSHDARVVDTTTQATATPVERITLMLLALGTTLVIRNGRVRSA
jgi:hypothetical protein